MRTLIPIIILVIGVCRSLVGQWPSSINGGARVQVRLPEVQYQFGGRRGHLLRGKVAALVADTLYLAITDSLSPLPIPRRMIERLEYSRGVPSRGASALRRGLISAVGGSLVLVLWNELGDDNDRVSTGTAALMGGGAGLVAGGVQGALFPRERWKRVRLEEGSAAH